MISAPLKDAGQPEAGGVDPAELQRYFIKQRSLHRGRRDAISPSLLTGDGDASASGRGFRVGKRFHSAPVVRLGDAKPMELGQSCEADGRWRLIAFADAPIPLRRPRASARSANSCELARDSPLRRYTPPGADIDAVIDLRAVFQQGHRELNIGAMPVAAAAEEGPARPASTTKRCSARPEERRRHLRHARHRSRARRAGHRATGPIRRARAAARWL